MGQCGYDCCLFPPISSCPSSSPGMSVNIFRQRQYILSKKVLQPSLNSGLIDNKFVCRHQVLLYKASFILKHVLEGSGSVRILFCCHVFFASLLLNLMAFKCRGKKCWNREKSSPQTLDAVAGSDQWLGGGRRKKSLDSSGSLSQWFQGKRLKAGSQMN